MPLPFVLPSFIFTGGQQLGFGGTSPQIDYVRGSEVVDEATGEWAIRGTITVGGHTFDTIERAGGFVALKPGTYPATMERSPNNGVVVDKLGVAVKDANGKYMKKKDMQADQGQKFVGRKQLRPKHTQTNNKGEHAAILIHPGTRPSHFLGCIGVGVKEAKGLSKSSESLEDIWKLLGGFKEGKVVYLNVTGENPGKTKPK